MLSLDLLYLHLCAHVIHELHEFSLDLFAQEVDVLSEGMLSVFFWEGFVPIIITQTVSNFVQSRAWSQEES